MSVTQNEKIRQVTETTMVIGVDIASETHWARAFDWRGLELGKAVKFEKSAEGFNYFLRWASELAAEQKKGNVMVGVEPTGHYWFTLAAYLQGSSIKLVPVNPYHVKRSKELDDGHPSKSDKKDPKTIAKLVLEGRYMFPYIPQGLYAELRVAMNCRWRVQKELTSVQNQIQRWLKIYFPEHKTVFGNFEGTGSMALLHAAPFPSDLVALGVDGINQIWRQMKLRCVGLKRAQRAFEAAQNSVGCTTGIEAARMEMQILLEDYDAKLQQYERIMEVVESLCSQIPEVEELLKIKGIGLPTVAGIFAEVGDIRRFSSPRQL